MLDKGSMQVLRQYYKDAARREGLPEEWVNLRCMEDLYRDAVLSLVKEYICKLPMEEQEEFAGQVERLAKAMLNVEDKSDQIRKAGGFSYEY